MAKPATGTKTKKRAGSRAMNAAAAAGGGRLTVRHYCQGIGDSHLLGFPKANGDTYWMLIDCGVHSGVPSGSKMMDDVVANIAEVTQNRLDVIVITHEHQDHVSAFLSAAEHFKPFSVGEVWMAWTENPDDAQARLLDTYRQHALAALELTSQHLNGVTGMSSHLSSLMDGLHGLAGFNFGVKGQRVRASRDAATALAKGRVRYLEPSDPPVTIADLPGIRIYVLGPPRDKKLLGLTERQSEMYGAAAATGWPIAQALSSAFRAIAGRPSEEEACDRPFDLSVGTDLARISAMVPATDPEAKIAAFANDHYFGQPAPAKTTASGKSTDAAASTGTDQSWRRIDNDWLGVSADLAMQLDSKTNNTSLVLAFEFIDTRRVLLFAADAQVGSWLSWQDIQWKLDDETVTGPDLLARTVYYKVGHHGSHNATLQKKGLELMTSEDLAAFIPTNKHDAAKIGWKEMPFDSILTALAERCRGRVIRSDDNWIRSGAAKPNFGDSGGSIVGLDCGQGLWVELQLA